MTEQIKSAIADFQEWIDRAEEFDPNVQSEHVKAMKLAIRSLQAWEEVIKELEKKKKAIYTTDGDNWELAYDKFTINAIIDIINRHLAEIEEGEEYERL